MHPFHPRRSFSVVKYFLDPVKELPWPKQEEFYMVKQFIVVK